MNKLLNFTLIWTCLAIYNVKGQAPSASSAMYVELEPITGVIGPNHRDFPETGPIFGLFLNIGHMHLNNSQLWPVYYNYPKTGISFGYLNLNNDEVFGRMSILTPYLVLNTSRNKPDAWAFKFGLGLARFSTFHDPEQNPDNLIIGSHFNWAFHLGLHKKWRINDKLNMKAGSYYLHASNGHVQLPNYGFNALTGNLSIEYYMRSNNPTKLPLTPGKIKSKANHLFQISSGTGLHELGSAKAPVGGPKKGVYSTSVAYGIIFNNHYKLRTGLTYRFYQHFYDYILDNEISDFLTNPVKASSNINYFIGNEFLIGHFSIDIEGGLNIYKPFFEYYSSHFLKSKQEINYWLKKLFSSRLGMNLYLINTNKNPTSNIFIGAAIYANFGQADFSGISIGYSYTLKNQYHLLN